MEGLLNSQQSRTRTPSAPPLSYTAASPLSYLVYRGRHNNFVMTRIREGVRGYRGEGVEEVCGPVAMPVSAHPADDITKVNYHINKDIFKELYFRKDFWTHSTISCSSESQSWKHSSVTLKLSDVWVDFLMPPGGKWASHTNQSANGK